MTNGNNTLQSYIDIAQSSKMPICVLDPLLLCVYGNGIIEKGTAVSKVLRGAANLPIRSCYEDTVILNDNFYYIRIYVISDAPSPPYYLCETIDCAQAWGIFHRAAPQQLSVVTASLRYGVNNISSIVAQLDQADSADNAHLDAVISNLKLETGKLFSIINGFGDYIDMMIMPEERVLFDVSKLCVRICQRCNAALAAYDRCIDMPLCDSGLYVYADGRRAVTALLNAVFNALMYSAHNVVPQIIAYCDDSTASAVIKLINTPFAAHGDRPDGLYGSAFDLSMAIVKRFAVLAGGNAEIQHADKTELKISIPIASYSDISLFRLEQDEFYDETEFDGYISDFINCCLKPSSKKTNNIQ